MKMIIFVLIATQILAVRSFSWSHLSQPRVRTGRVFSGGSDNLPPDGSGKNTLLPSDPLNKSHEDSIGSSISSSSNPILKRWLSLNPETRGDIKSTILAFSIALFVRVFLCEPRFIPSLSMYPTFDIGDQLLVDKISGINRRYQRHDVVVFNPSDTYIELTGNTEALIKRVIAVEGDTVEIKSDHRVYVNGVKQDEPFINEDPDYVLPLMTVPKGMLLVLGDNRNHSFDSHVWGFLPSKNVIGRAIVKYWPPWRVGGIEGVP